MRASLVLLVPLFVVAASRSRAAEPRLQPSSAPVAPAEAPRVAEEDEEEIEEIEEAGDLVLVADDRSLWFGEGYAHRDRFVAMHGARPTPHLSLRFIIDHRTNRSVSDNPFHDFFGFDGGGLKVGLGLRFGLWGWIDAGIYRLNNATDAFDTYELDVKVQALRQEAHQVDLAIRVGLSWFSQQDAQDAAGVLAQLLLMRRFAQRVAVGAGLLFHSNSTNQVKSNLDDAGSLALQLAGSWRIATWLSWDLEAAYALAGYTTRDKEGVDAYPTLSTALNFITNRHTFALVVSNNPNVAADGVVANTSRGFDELVIGFAISRQWDFSRE